MEAEMENVLELRDVTHVYGAGRTAVEAVSRADLQIKPGEIVLIMGPSGSGKTTLLSMAGLLLRPSQGRIWINGRETTGLQELKLPALRLRSIGFVFQAYNLLGALSARENVELVMNMAGIKGRAARERATQLLVGLGLGHRLDHRPADLSGGEKQRVAIARALANDPFLLLADEPTGNLDERATRGIVQLLREINALGTAVIMATHDLSLIMRSGYRYLELERGTLLYDGTDARRLTRHQ
jgi:ABC-type lipoprotein export system ATPase subunit